MAGACHPQRADGVCVDLHRFLFAGHADDGARTQCNNWQRGIHDLGLSDRLQSRAIGLGRGQRSLRPSHPGGGGARPVRHRLGRMRAVKQCRDDHFLAHRAGARRLCRRRVVPGHGARPLSRSARSPDALDPDRHHGDRAAARPDPWRADCRMGGLAGHLLDAGRRRSRDARSSVYDPGNLAGGAASDGASHPCIRRIRQGFS